MLFNPTAQLKKNVLLKPCGFTYITLFPVVATILKVLLIYAPCVGEIVTSEAAVHGTVQERNTLHIH